MSLKFYFGPSDGALSQRVYSDIVKRSMEHPEQNFLIIVPDQFTMQTQKELSLLHPRGGILNIDVLSFGRLGHRVLEEVGSREIPVLDDTGKSLVVQKVAAGLEERLPVLGGFLHRQGYIHEVKGAISEFMQYGISPRDMDNLLEFSKEKAALTGKLKDLQTIYRSFTDYIRDHFVTAEETLDVLRKNLAKSRLVRGSVIVLDGFTGFTPIQNRLIGALMELGKETILTLVCGREDSPYQLDGEQKLFYLTKKTVSDLEKLAKEKKVLRDRGEDVFLESEGDRESALSYLQEHLFRYGAACFGKSQSRIRLFEASNPSMEAHQTALYIQELIRKEGLAYRDITLICGDLEGYAPYIETEFEKLKIPCFIDRTRGITLNPLIEFIKSALNLHIRNFSYEAVMHYLRSGMTDITAQETDRLENYILETGIRGYRAYSGVFARRTARMDPQDETELEALNGIRERFLSQVDCLQGKDRDSAANYVDRLYDFLVDSDVQRKLAKQAEMFEKAGDCGRAKEYSQIYRMVMELLNQIYQLLGEEEISEQEFADILEAGFGEIQVGILPQNVDRILVGDMERTRFKPVKVLFFLGVNDGNIPRNTSKGGILSDMEREFLKDAELTLAPTPRQKMFIQRFYLYLNMTKPSQKLFLSYSRQGSDGKAVRPAYLIDTLKKMFSDLPTELPQNREFLEQIMTPEEGQDYLAEGLRRYAQGDLRPEEEGAFFALYDIYGTKELEKTRDVYTEAAFTRYQGSSLSREVSRLIYGSNLENSVSRLETFAACAYRHFLQYGLTLKEREEYGFQAADLGNIYHGVLSRFANCLEQEKKSWFDFDGDFAAGAVEKALREETAVYGNSIFAASSRNEYQVKRMERILTRTVLTLQKQLQKGSFTPREYEVSFRQVQELGNVGIALSPEEKMTLRGRIDRVDTAEDEGHIYVKIVDYKSGDKDFDLVALYHGLQLQLVVYMNAALEREAVRYPDKEIVPAALLYYHVDDPMVEGTQEPSREELDEQILRCLRTRGIVDGSEQVIGLLDKSFAEKSDVIPVERKKDGSYMARAGVMSGEDLRAVSDFVNRRIRKMGREILDGKIALDPCELGAQDACAYCPYGKVCGFDAGIPGCQKRKLENMSREEVLKRIGEESE